MLFDEFIYTNREDLFRQYYKDKEFCDCQGNVFKVVDKRPPVSFWRNFFQFLPNIYKVELRFIQENKKLTIDDLRDFILNRLEEINTNDFVPKWIDSVKNATRTTMSRPYFYIKRFDSISTGYSITRVN